MNYEMPKDKNYIAEGNVIVSLEEYNKLNTAMEVLKKDQGVLSIEQAKLRSAVKGKMFLSTHTTHGSRYPLYGYDNHSYITYDLSKDAEELLKPVLEERLKDEMKKVYKEFSGMSFHVFLQWRKGYKENIFNQ